MSTYEGVRGRRSVLLHIRTSNEKVDGIFLEHVGQIRHDIAESSHIIADAAFLSEIWQCSACQLGDISGLELVAEHYLELDSCSRKRSPLPVFVPNGGKCRQQEAAESRRRVEANVMLVISSYVRNLQYVSTVCSHASSVLDTRSPR